MAEIDVCAVAFAQCTNVYQKQMAFFLFSLFEGFINKKERGKRKAAFSLLFPTPFFMPKSA